MVPNEANTFCVLPDRFDMIYHFVKYGGIDGLKENFELLLSRMQTFENHDEDHQITKKLFSNEFFEAIRNSCPKTEQVLDVFDQSVVIRVIIILIKNQETNFSASRTNDTN